MENWWRLSHMYVAVFLAVFAGFLVGPAITDVVVAAVCGAKEECSLAIYLTGLQQAISGLGAVVMMPLMGNLSDIYGRKRLLLLSMSASIFPLVILACGRTAKFVYAYYAIKTLTSLVDGGVLFLALAFLADNVREEKRVSAFGLMVGVISVGMICANSAAIFVSTNHIFQLATALLMLALVYAIALIDEESKCKRCDLLEQPILERDGAGSSKCTDLIRKSIPSARDIIYLFKRSDTVLLVLCVSFLNSFAEGGTIATQTYSFKARFHFNKKQFAELGVIGDVGSILVNMFIVPVFGTFIGDKKLLALGLIAGFLAMLLNSIAWSSWVLYASACLGIFSSIIDVNLRSMISRQIGPDEQGMVQGCTSSITSLGFLAAPLICSPLTALFLSENAPFDFPGFSLFCIALAYLMGYIVSVFIKIDSRSNSKHAINVR